MVSKHHIHHAIHHKLTSDLPRFTTTNSRNPLKNTSKSHGFSHPPRQKKNYSLAKNSWLKRSPF
jgi:hypothetical protein